LRGYADVSVSVFACASSYFSNNEPWILAKQLRNSRDPSSAEHQALQKRLDTVLYLTIDAVRMSGMCVCFLLLFYSSKALALTSSLLAFIFACAAILLQPVVPESTTKILDYLAVPPATRSFEYATMMDASSSNGGTRIDNARSFVAFPKLLK
jgi:methionyl-tRNA synthetase